MSNDGAARIPLARSVVAYDSACQGNCLVHLPYTKLSLEVSCYY